QAGQARQARQARRARKARKARHARQARQAWRAVESAPPRQAATKTQPVDAPSGTKKKSTQEMALYISTALSEWGMSLSDLDDIEYSVPAGQITASELKARKGG
ncbi:MAG: hypothetical protein QF464_01830, partial [Myxococcota bacterium]|nr:hypothetical protein [Myxococcota bacterium]